ncbi:MAG: HAD hydrolase-like protein [Sulfuricurvum sp.]|uniref:HAD family hydrolase n=1 Tax=Sulfuricurvum sp. TaxID=2025608 RepID=UPI002636FDAC|nr:HAD hydrolase-like protein [Sulfuricurvum sp.]MDD2830178.1 HAD hydrolase-like protein [Sulfuricurvum sp.]MDD4949242.1 HAD hydrolase-like protein [Sulfuricurvum sp.]
MSNLATMLTEYDTVLFDLDGTLFSQIDYDYRVFTSFFKDHTIAMMLANFKASLGYAHPNVFDLFAVQHSEIDFSVQELLSFYRTYLPDLSDLKTLSPLLSQLCEKRKILISNGGEIKQWHKIRSLNLESFFETIIILDPHRNDLLKPSPQSFLTLEPFPAKAVMVGDQESTDGVFASNCHIPFIFFQFPSDITSKE